MTAAPGGEGERAGAARALLVKVDELYLKGDNRPAFLHRLLANVEAALGAAEPPARLHPMAGKILVTGRGHDPDTVARLRRVFGLNRIEEVLLCGHGIDEIVAAALEAAAPLAGSPLSFKVDCRRSWKRHPMKSVEVNRAVGEAVARATGMKVDLGKPGVEVRVLIDPRRSYVSTAAHRGPGGLPVGTGGKALLLLSGGIDSPVAGWLAMRRGLSLECVHFHSPPYTGPALLRKVEDLRDVLARACPRMPLHLAAFTRAQERVRDAVRLDYRVIMYRWVMVAVAARLAAARGLEALVTGENLGQVASQTLQNLACLDGASAIPILRPLVTFNKLETVGLSREIGAFDISVRPGADCCTLFVPEHPTVRARRELCAEYGALLEKEGIVEECVGSVETV